MKRQQFCKKDGFPWQRLIGASLGGPKLDLLIFILAGGQACNLLNLMSQWTKKIFLPIPDSNWLRLGTSRRHDRIPLNAERLSILSEYFSILSEYFSILWEYFLILWEYFSILWEYFSILLALNTYKQFWSLDPLNHQVNHWRYFSMTFSFFSLFKCKIKYFCVQLILPKIWGLKIPSNGRLFPKSARSSFGH